MANENQPTYEQLAVDLRANQIAVDVARAQRNQALDQIADLTARLDMAMNALQATNNEKGTLVQEVADLTEKLANRETRRAKN